MIIENLDYLVEDTANVDTIVGGDYYCDDDYYPKKKWDDYYPKKKWDCYYPKKKWDWDCY